MAGKRIKDLMSTATSADMVAGAFVPLDTPDKTKKLPIELLGGSGGPSTLFKTVADMQAASLNVGDVVETATTWCP